MDISLARTFLAIVSGGSFAHAAQQLHLTQTAISARVKTLESLLGRRLFVRNKAGASLTTAGEQFVRHAATLVQVWQRARQQVAVPIGRRAVLTVGCEVSLWDPLLLDWLLHMRGAAPHLALHTEVGFPTDLLGRVADGTLEIAVVYAPQQRPGLRVDLLIEEKLVMVTTAANGRMPAPADYVYVDWGPEFAAQHGLAFPQFANAPISASLGPLGREYVLAAGGAGYFRLDVVRSAIEEGRLHRVKHAPEFLYPAYAVYADTADAELLAPALEGLRQVAGAHTTHLSLRKASTAVLPVLATAVTKTKTKASTKTPPKTPPKSPPKTLVRTSAKADVKATPAPPRRRSAAARLRTRLPR